MNRLILSVLAAIIMAFSSPGARADETIILSQAELGKLCIVWSNWLNGKASCSRVIADDGWYRGNGVKFRKI